VTEEALSGVARGLWTVFGAAALILLLSCVNVAHLLLERISARTRELAVRRALGAHRNRVLRQLATESVLLGLLGGAAGIALAYGGTRVLLRLAPADIPRLENVAIDLPTLAFATAASLVAATLFGIAPVIFGWSGDVHATLRAQGKGAAGGAHGHRTRAILTTLEVAFAVVILIGAGPKAFVAGADISELAAVDRQQGVEMAAHGSRVFRQIEQLRKPVIAAVNGFALGGGCELAMACHVRLAAPNARFAQPEVKLGLIPGFGGTVRLTKATHETGTDRLAGRKFDRCGAESGADGLSLLRSRTFAK